MPPANVFEWLDEVRARPGTWLRDGTLVELETLVHGYTTALTVHRIHEGLPSMLHFSDWLGWKGVSGLAVGWARAIEARALRLQRPALALFFELVEEYRRLRPVVVAGAPARAGADRVEIVRYEPDGLVFLRVHVAGGFHDAPIVHSTSGRASTSVDVARRRAERDHGIHWDDWSDVG